MLDLIPPSDKGICDLFMQPVALAYTKKAANGIRHNLLQLIERSTKSAADSRSEVLGCLNVDWFKV